MKYLALPCLILAVAAARAESVKNLEGWTITGPISMDAAKPGPSGQPSIKVEPKSLATLKLRDADGSGKVSFFVYDDGVIASPDKKKAVGPRWGLGETTGRIFVGAIMYARYLQPEGSYCLLDADPKDKGAWLAVKFIGPRGQPGWKKWEFSYDPETGLAVSVDGKPVPQKYFDWNTSQASGFNGLVLYGDDTPEATAQTVWIADIDYELGPPMKATPGSLPTPTPAPPAAPKGPAPEEETEKSSTPPVMGKMEGFLPGPTLLDDLKGLKVPLVAGYDSRHPRLLFTSDDRAALQKRSLERPDLWDPVMASAKGLLSPESVPTPEVIRSGAKYWRIERVQSAALAWFVTGEKKYAEGAIRWMVAHCKESIWGDKYRPNLDLIASWYLYYISVGYDILKNEMSAEDRKIIADGLAEHAKYMYAALDPYETKEKIRYDQNHTYIPTVAMISASLALLEDNPEARYWLTRGYAVLRRCRYVLSEDGYYYEGVGYWTYALNWHIKGAELLARATGEKLFELPALSDTWLFGLHFRLPGTPGVFGVGDVFSWVKSELKDIRVTNYSMLWEIAAQTNSPESRTVGDLYHAREPEREYPATAFLWFNPEVSAKPLEEIDPYHYFPDHGVIAWRSGWGDDATSYLFRCGPPLGHKALAKTQQLKDWTMNCGHVHPDIGTFWMFARGAYLAVDTGYTAEKWTKDSNTLLVDGKGQAMDGAYHNERGVPYADLDQARITSQYLSEEYGFARGEFGRVYKRQVDGVDLQRSLLMTKDWLLVVDDMAADQPRSLTWLCHSVGDFKPRGAAFVSDQAKASLAVFPLTEGAEVKSEPTTVMAGMAPGRGAPEQRGFKLAVNTKAPVARTRFINVLVPLAAGEAPPAVKLLKNEGDIVSISVTRPDGTIETAEVDLSWKSGGDKGPATIAKK